MTTMTRRGLFGMLLGLPLVPVLAKAAAATPPLVTHGKLLIFKERIWYGAVTNAQNWVYHYSQVNNPEDWTADGNAGVISREG